LRGVLKLRSERNARDAYFTPAPLALAICKLLEPTLPAQSWVWDPCCGDGVFVDAAAEAWHEQYLRSGPCTEERCGTGGLQFSGNDLATGWDFLARKPVSTPSLIVSNPPFLLAESFVHRALKLIAHGGHVAFLLRLSFLGGQGRADSLWSARNLRWLAPITPRPSFTPDGKTDAAEYALFVWQRGYVGNAELLAPLRWSRSKQLPLRGPDSDPEEGA
jgi:hypothetical protein